MLFDFVYQIFEKIKLANNLLHDVSEILSNSIKNYSKKENSN